MASGARYGRLPLERWSEFENAGIYYAATELEARSCRGSEVAVIGGANSAGQAALFLASKGSIVRLIVRGDDLSKKMSRYLVDRVVSHPRIEVHLSSEVVGLTGGDRLEAVTVEDRSTGGRTEIGCQGLFCFIGAVPSTGWLDGVERDDAGFVYTGNAVPPESGPAHVRPAGPASVPLRVERARCLRRRRRTERLDEAGGRRGGRRGFRRQLGAPGRGQIGPALGWGPPPLSFSGSLRNCASPCGSLGFWALGPSPAGAFAAYSLWTVPYATGE